MLIAVAAALVPASAVAAEKKRSGGEDYLPFPTLTAAVFLADGGRGVLTVEVGLEVHDATLRKRAQDSTPRLRDAYNRTLAEQARSLSPGSPPDVDAYARALQIQTDRALGRRGATLLLGTVMVN